jgi:hypothetical protein
MNLPRLRELLKAWQDGSIREAELLELRDALPEVLARVNAADDLLRTVVGMNNMPAVHSWIDAYFLRHS